MRRTCQKYEISSVVQKMRGMDTARKTRTVSESRRSLLLLLLPLHVDQVSMVLGAWRTGQWQFLKFLDIGRWKFLDLPAKDIRVKKLERVPFVIGEKLRTMTPPVEPRMRYHAT